MPNLPEVLVIDAHDLRDPRPREVTPPVEDDVSDRRVELDSEEDPVCPHRGRGYEERVAVLSGRVGLLESVINIITYPSISYGWADITKISTTQTRHRIFQVK